MIATLCSLRYVKDIPFTRFRSGSKEFNVSMSCAEIETVVRSLISSKLFRWNEESEIIAKLLKLHKCQFVFDKYNVVSTFVTNNAEWQNFLRDVDILTCDISQLCDEYVEVAVEEKKNLLSLLESVTLSD